MLSCDACPLYPSSPFSLMIFLTHSFSLTPPALITPTRVATVWTYSVSDINYLHRHHVPRSIRWYSIPVCSTHLIYTLWRHPAPSFSLPKNSFRLCSPSSNTSVLPKYGFILNRKINSLLRSPHVLSSSTIPPFTSPEPPIWNVNQIKGYTNSYRPFRGRWTRTVQSFYECLVGWTTRCLTRCGVGVLMRKRGFSEGDSLECDS